MGRRPATRPTLRRSLPVAEALGRWFAAHWKRIASVLTVVLVIGLVALLLVPKLLLQLRGEPQPKPTVYPTPVACPAEAVRIELAIPEVAAAGKPLAIEMSVSTTSELPCLIPAGASSLGMLITSGQETVINTLACAGEQAAPRPLLLKAGDLWKGSLSWDGVVRGEGCAPVAEAQAGTYVIQLLLNGEKVGDQHVLVLE